MTPLLAVIGELLQHTQELLLAALILARTMSMVVLTPFLGGKVIPNEVKMGLGILLAIVAWPVARESVAIVPTSGAFFLVLMLKEIFIGYCIGFVNGHIFTALEMAGRIIDTARGSSMAEVMVPHSGQRVTTTGNLYYQLFLVVFMAVGAHRVFLQGYFMTFAALPLDVGLNLGATAEPFYSFMIRMTADVWLISVLLSFPVVAATLITDVVFGILNRVAPSLNAYFMSMPVKAMGGIIMVLVVMGAFMEQLQRYVVWTLSHIEQTIDYLVATI